MLGCSHRRCYRRRALGLQVLLVDWRSCSDLVIGWWGSLIGRFRVWGIGRHCSASWYVAIEDLFAVFKRNKSGH